MSIRISKLAVAYGQERVIDDLNLSVGNGQFFTLLGPSGCGKTTLLRTIAGFIPVAAGSIEFGDRDVTRLPAHQRDIGMVFQDYALFPNYTVFDNVAYGLRARKVSETIIAQKVNQALDRVDLGRFTDRHPAALSGGQRQRVALARALVITPQVLLMDEPLSNLDAKLRVTVRETIAQLQKEAGITTIFVTHDQEEALALSDQIAVMNLGRIEQLGSPSMIYNEPATGFVADFVGAANVLPISQDQIALENGRNHVTIGGGRVQLLQEVSATIQKQSAVIKLAIRPEHIALHPVAQADDLLASIVSQQFLGVKTRYRVQFADKQSLIVEHYGADRLALPNGAVVGLRFDPQRTRLLSA